MEVLEIENTTFYPDKIVFTNKKGVNEIEFEDIEQMRYTKPTFLNYFFAIVSDLIIGCAYPKVLDIYYVNKNGKRRIHSLKIEYEDFLKLPESYKKIVKIT